ncbi:MAG: mechanosensitive ion channel family protein [Candidatus Bathyarchaeota archaeon]|uniref:mechanosensitive ion channel family protein n=1 Tax=Candidatus Bathycorpusculum sp. TaxID=2994959 RepID=UPI0028308AD4|nr:mechanosensitive ion channel family protein [Candidatus Termiticorpusculum sp.]MCL2257256.1 mechanosensitive ion channel family protein [Candidatus Termiticorpusculum sp.]MCL2292589.1 mechanosensitive ion channel family protein [Candidatus Termiticorpusculum sp.]
MSLNETISSPVTNISGTFQRLLNTTSTNAEILVALLIFSITAFVGLISYVIISKYINKWAEKTTTTLGDKIATTLRAVIIIVIANITISFSLKPLTFLEPYSNILIKLFLVIQILLTAYAVSKIVNSLIDLFAEKTTIATSQKNVKHKKHQIFILKKAITIIVFSTAIIIIILNMLEVTKLWEATFTSLGIGAIIVGFVLQSVLSDFFSSLYIYFDRPFEIGDLIFVGEHGGTVKNIGILTTRLQLLQGEELIISNKELSSEYIRNFRKLQKRRIVFNLGVTYDTPNETLRKIPQMIIDVIKSVKDATPQFVNFNEFGEYSLKFFISYFVNSSEYAKYLDVQQEINLGIREAFEREGIEIAHLTNIAYIKRK